MGNELNCSALGREIDLNYTVSWQDERVLGDVEISGRIGTV